MVAIFEPIIKPMRIVALCVIIMSFVSGIARADSYKVSATIPYPAPNQAATVDGSTDGTTVSDALQTFTGTCQLQNPADVVSVWRNGNSIGSAPCNGTYSVQVMLEPGINTLTMRTANASLIYGPDATPFTITLVLPDEPTPAPAQPAPATPTPQNETTDQVTVATNAGAAGDLTATTKEPFSVLTSNNDVTIQVTVGGGQSPYTIWLDWGDGSTESHDLDQAGAYSFTHSYQKAGSYIVRGDIHDVLGASTKFMYAVVSPDPIDATQNASGSDVVPSKPNLVWNFFAHHWKPVALTFGAVSFLGAGYLFGAHTAVGNVVTQSRIHRVPKPKQVPKNGKVRKNV